MVVSCTSASPAQQTEHPNIVYPGQLNCSWNHHTQRQIHCSIPHDFNHGGVVHIGQPRSNQLNTKTPRTQDNMNSSWNHHRHRDK
jgi:hypothetical protein